MTRRRHFSKLKEARKISNLFYLKPAIKQHINTKNSEKETLAQNKTQKVPQSKVHLLKRMKKIPKAPNRKTQHK